MTLDPNATDRLVTGGADSTIHVWRDNTSQQEDLERDQLEARVLKEQDLLNHVYRKDFAKAVEVAFELGHSYRLWQVLSDLHDAQGPTAFDKMVRGWTDQRLSTCLGYLRDWNTNARRAAVAQALLGSIFQCVPFTRLRAVKGVASMIEGILPYTERHFQRIDGLAEASFLLDFTLNSIAMCEDRAASVHADMEEMDMV